MPHKKPKKEIPKPGDPDFIGPVKPEPPKPGDPGFIGPVKPEPTQPALGRGGKTLVELGSEGVASSTAIPTEGLGGKKTGEEILEGVTLTTDQANRILAGTLKATTETTAAVKAGTVNIQDPTPAEQIQAAAIKTLGAISLATRFQRLRGGARTVRVIGTGIKDNTANDKLLLSAANKLVIGKGWKIAGAAGLALILAKEILQLTLGGKVFGQFIGMEEASQTANIAARDALINDNIAGYQAAAAARNEVLMNKTFWEEMATYVPFKNVLDELENYREAAIVSADVYDQIAEDKESGGTFEEGAARMREEKTAADKAAVDYYNQERKQMVKWERQAQVDGRNEDSGFWASQRRKQRKLEELERKAIADFWLEYQRKKLEIERESRLAGGTPTSITTSRTTARGTRRAGNVSSLNFGL